jgi:hypothetical protein
LKTQQISTELLGRAFIPDLPCENPDGSPLKIDKDYFGRNGMIKSNERTFENPVREH